MIRNTDFSSVSVNKVTPLDNEIILISTPILGTVWNTGYWQMPPSTIGTSAGWNYTAAIDVSLYAGKLFKIISSRSIYQGENRGTHGDWCWIEYQDGTVKKVTGDDEYSLNIVEQTFEYGTFIMPQNVVRFYMGESNYQHSLVSPDEALLSVIL